MAKKATSQAGKSQKAVSQNEKKTEEDLMLEVSNESEQVDETSSESYCPFDLLEGDETEAIYASFSQKELKEIIKKDEEELGPLPEAILGVDCDASLPFYIHIVKDLVLHLPAGKQTCLFDDPVRQRRLPVVNMRDNAEIADPAFLNPSQTRSS